MTPTASIGWSARRRFAAGLAALVAAASWATSSWAATSWAAASWEAAPPQAPPAAAAAPAPTAEAAPAPLVPGAPVERSIGGAEVQRYRVELASGRPWLLTLEQHGVDVVLEAAPADGDGDGNDDGERLAVESPLHRDGPETLLLEPAEGGAWEVAVRSAEAAGTDGTYRLRIDALPTAGEAAQARLAAERVSSEAGLAVQLDTPESNRRALEACRRAHDLWQALGESRRAAVSDHCAGALARQLSEPRIAEESLRRAAASWRALGEPALRVHALNELGLTLWQGGDLAGAQAIFEQALGVGIGGERPALDASTRNNLCLVLHYQGQLDAARACYEKALPQVEALGQPNLLAVLSQNLGGVHYLLGEPEPAQRYYRRALELYRQTGAKRGEAEVFNNIAALDSATGEFQEALDGYEQAEQIYRELGDVRGEARALNNLGNTYQHLGDRERARSYYERALPLRREAHDPRGEAVTLNNLGSLLREEGDAQSALGYHQRSLALRAGQGQQRGEGLTRQLIGRARQAMGDLGGALDDYAAAVESLRAVGARRSLAETQRYRAEALAAAGRGGEAEAVLGEALDLYRACGDRNGEALAEIAYAGLDRAAGRDGKALGRLESAVATLEGLRAAVDAPDLRASYLASQRSAYEQLVDLHLKRGAVDAALEVAEAASARSLLDLVQAAASDLPRSIDPELAARREALEHELRIKIDRRLDLGEDEAPEKVARLEGEIDRLLTALDTVESGIRGASSRYADLTRPPLLSAAEMRGMLDDDTVLLRYSLGEERSWLWRVTHGTTTVYELPPRQRIEDLARSVHQGLSHAGGDAAAASRELAGLVLGPVAGELAAKRVLVVADGALHYLPFGALPLPGSGPEGSPQRLLDQHDVVTAPSMSVLALQRRALGERTGATRTLAVIADPVFDSEDFRVARAAAADGGGGEPARRGGSFSRLRFSRREAQEIAALVPADQRMVALDFAASRQTVLGGELAPYRIVHFATHGVLDAERPELSGLVLSRVDAEGHPQLGLLGLRDLYHLRLAADLVVLSGCRTALGREVRGEGLVGLTRGFLYAGVPRVVASLWQVDDRATAELMTAFYRGLLTEGLEPDEALRQAQLALRAEPRTRDPYYWAPFVLQGDWHRSPAAKRNRVAANDTPD